MASPKPKSEADALRSALTSVTKEWTRQRKAEERSARSVFGRSSLYQRMYNMTIEEAANKVMREAYLAASDNGRLPVKARQIMYAARPKILQMTGRSSLNDAYFTQTLLPDYMESHDCWDWDVVWDARGTFQEPHTKRRVPIGTLEVRQYLGDRPEFNGGDYDPDLQFPTKGPENRYNSVLFVEKEGFDPLLKAAKLEARYDLATMSTKGMSTTAARMLIDRLVERGVQKILVAHDFDVSGFSIFGTLGTDGRRYRFENEIPIFDLGLRLDDVEAMGLQSEPVAFKTSESRARRAETLRWHGATDEECEFLLGDGYSYGNRVELNAMTSQRFVEFLEQKLEEHGVEKVIPVDETLAKHARRVLEQLMIRDEIDKIRDSITELTASEPLPEDLRQRVDEALKGTPSLSWDEAVANIVEELHERPGDRLRSKADS